jgi:hypothetical protein
MRAILAILIILSLAGCSTNAEFKRPEDVTALRASYTKASFIYSVFVGGTEVCQITALDRKDAQERESAASLLGDYGVVLDEDGCSILPSSLLEKIQ